MSKVQKLDFGFWSRIERIRKFLRKRDLLHPSLEGKLTHHLSRLANNLDKGNFNPEIWQKMDKDLYSMFIGENQTN